MSEKVDALGSKLRSKLNKTTAKIVLAKEIAFEPEEGFEEIKSGFGKKSKKEKILSSR
ncbi:MAG: hypothetical protein AAGB24_13025 [Bacteroidota bacterium]